jgi:hypothetical protein
VLLARQLDTGFDDTHTTRMGSMAHLADQIAGVQLGPRRLAFAERWHSTFTFARCVRYSHWMEESSRIARFRPTQDDGAESSATKRRTCDVKRVLDRHLS